MSEKLPILAGKNIPLHAPVEEIVASKSSWQHHQVNLSLLSERGREFNWAHFGDACSASNGVLE
jgi:hypothetical protein